MTNWKEKYFIGSRWKCRGGGEAVVVRHCGDALLVYFPSVNEAVWFSTDGTCRGCAVGRNDLISPWVEPMRGEFWVNVYPRNDGAYGGPAGGGWDSKAEADEAASPDRIACKHVQWTEGEGL